MRKLLLSMCFLGCALWAQAKDLTQYVNPLMGTLSSFELSTGNTYPAIARPWGMNFWTPQTGKMGDGWQYVYTAHKIRGFKQTHQPSPWINDYGQFSIMPVVGKPEFNEDKRASWFSHKGEVALPHYYKVYLAEHDVVTEFTPTERAVLFRFTFPENDEHYVMSMIENAQVEILVQTISEHGVQPGLWVRQLGKGRVCCVTPGHTTKNLLCREYIHLIKNAVAWCTE